MRIKMKSTASEKNTLEKEKGKAIVI